MCSFKLVQAKTFSEAVALLADNQNAKAILGGTDLMVMLEKGTLSVDCLIDLTGIPGIADITEDASYYVFGAGVTLAEIAQWSKAHDEFSAIGEAAVSIGTPQVRNIATWTGNICNAVPSCDMGAPSLIFDVEVCIVSTDAERWFPVCELFAGSKRTTLKRTELIKAIRIPKIRPECRSTYIKYGPRNASDLAMVGVAVRILSDGKNAEEIRIALGAVAPTPIEVECVRAFAGREISETLVNACAEAAKEAAKPITDFRASAEFRREVVGTETARAMRKLFERV